MSPDRIPDGYVPARRRGIDAFVWERAAVWLEEALDTYPTVAAWAEAKSVDALEGRGPVWVVPALASGPAGAARWAVRHYRRGGWAASPLVDRYLSLGPSRPHREALASALARARGVHTPAVVAGATYAAWGGAVYRADLVTELVPEAHSLAEVVAAHDTTALSLALRSAGRLTASLARAGVDHADLNARNILVDAGGDAWVIDLDRARVSPDGGPVSGRAMVARLERSLRKLGRQGGWGLTEANLGALRHGFAEGA